MRRFRLSYTPRAVRDLKTIHDLIARRDVESALRHIAKLEATIATLADVGDALELSIEGRRLRLPIYHRIVKPYRVLYRIDGSAVVVLQVRHAARRPATRDEFTD